MNRLLHLSAIQLFGILVGLPILLNILDIVFSPNHYISLYYFAPLITLITLSFLFIWLWTIGSNLTKMLPNDYPLHLSRFKAALATSFFLLSLTVILQLLLLEKFTSGQLSGLAFVAFIPQVMAIPCLLYSFYFIAKALKSIEVNREASFSEFSEEFFMLMFFPIGLWFIQPRINRLFGKRQALDI